MNMTRVLWHFFFCWCGLSAAFGQLYNPADLLLTPLKVYQCANFDPVIKSNFNFHDGVIDIEFDLEEDFTDIYQGKLNISKWIDGGWNGGANFLDKACVLFQTHCAKSWKQIREGFTPTIPGDCLIEPGHYKISDFEVWGKDLNIALIDTGKFLVRAVLLDEVDTEVLCIMMEIEVSEK